MMFGFKRMKGAYMLKRFPVTLDCVALAFEHLTENATALLVDNP